MCLLSCVDRGRFPSESRWSLSLDQRTPSHSHPRFHSGIYRPFLRLHYLCCCSLCSHYLCFRSLSFHPRFETTTGNNLLSEVRAGFEELKTSVFSPPRFSAKTPRLVTYIHKSRWVRTVSRTVFFMLGAVIMWSSSDLDDAVASVATCYCIDAVTQF